MKAVFGPAVLVSLVLLPALPLRAQTPVRPGAATADSALEQPNDFRLLRLAKWTTLAGAVGAGVYGFIRNERADDEYRELERLCSNDPQRCGMDTSRGIYADPALQARYDKARAIDRESHVALIASQVGVAATVVLFLLDLGNTRPPPDIPYVPSGLSFGPTGDGRSALTVRLPLGNGPRERQR